MWRKLFAVDRSAAGRGSFSGRASGTLRGQVETDVANVEGLIFSHQVPGVTLDLFL
jgi:hypothetical protein